MGFSYKELATKIAQNELENRVKSDDLIIYAENWSHLFTNSRVIDMSKPLLTNWQKSLIMVGTTFTSFMLLNLTLPVSVPSLATMATAIVIGKVLESAAIDLAYKAKDFPRTTRTLKLFSELTLLPTLYRGIKETAKELKGDEAEPKFALAH